MNLTAEDLSIISCIGIKIDSVSYTSLDKIHVQKQQQ